MGIISPTAPTQKTEIAWRLIDGPCPRCGAVGTCHKAGKALACRWATSCQIRAHVGRYPGPTATYALTNVDESTPDFPNAIRYYIPVSEDELWERGA